jgi:hypothetical protein
MKCPVCNRGEMREKVISDTKREWLCDNDECAHKEAQVQPPRESVSIADMVQSRTIKVRTIQEGGVPVLVSGTSGISKFASLSSFQLDIKNTGQMFVNNMNITYSPHTETTTTTINNLQDIFLQIDKSSHSLEEKEKIKGTLSKVDNLLRSLGGTLNTAAPYLQLFVNLISR